MAPTSLKGFLLFILLNVVSVSNAGDVIIPSAPKLAAKAYVLMDATSGKVLVAHNAEEHRPIASLTKMMTSYILSDELDKGNVSIDDRVPISENAWAQNPVFRGSSRMFIEVGKQVRLGDLHRGIIISSGNDASVAVAEHLAGSESAFADVMNQRAMRLGMTDSNFVNSHGLSAENQYSTALDLARLANGIIRDFPEDYRLYAERSFTFNNIDQPNRNKLLWRDPTVDGLKTGYTEKAGYCLVASAERNSMRLIAVVLGTRSVEARAQEAQKLLSYGFRYFETLKLYEAGQQLNEVRLWAGASDTVKLGTAEDVFITIPRGRRSALKAEMEFDEVIKGPVTSGESFGQLRITLEGKPILQDSERGKILAPDLVALESIEEAGFFGRLWDALMLLIYQVLGLPTS